MKMRGQIKARVVGEKKRRKDVAKERGRGISVKETYVKMRYSQQVLAGSLLCKWDSFCSYRLLRQARMQS